MRRYMTLVALALGFAACGGNPAPSSPAASATPAMSPVDAAAATITPDDMYRRIAYLASDELEGRNTPSPGLEMAAEYVAGQFESFGLSPAGDDGTFIQRWSYPQTSFDRSSTSLTLKAGAVTAEPVWGRAWFVLPAMGAETAAAPLVYAGTAAAGRAPLGSAAAGSFAAFYLPGTEPDMAWQGALQAGMMAAGGANVRGVVYILDPAFDSGMISQIADEVAAAQVPLFVIGLDYASAHDVFAAGGVDLDALREAGSTSVTPVEGGMLEVHAKRTVSESRPPNVIGMLIGSDPVLRDQYIVFSAHMDHVGVGPPDAEGDSIYNGADDDASGTATMMEVAQAFASLPRRPARSMIFLAVSGEEKGLLGSQHFTEAPPVPLNRMVADINLDMVGRNNPDSVVAIGMDYSSLGELVQEVAAAHPELSMTVAPDLWPEEQLFFRSDHFNFAKAGVPAIFFTTGLHDQYHKPSDEVELIDRDKIARVGRLAFYLAYEIATRPDAPVWTEKGLEEVKPAGRGGG